MHFKPFYILALILISIISFSTILLVFLDYPLEELSKFFILFSFVIYLAMLYWRNNPIDVKLTNTHIKKIYLNLFTFQERMIKIDLNNIKTFHIVCGYDNNKLIATVRLFYVQDKKELKTVIPLYEVSFQDLSNKILEYKKWNSRILLECEKSIQEHINDELKKQNTSLIKLGLKFQENNFDIVANLGD